MGASDNTVGGTTAAALNLISANYWGVRLDDTPVPPSDQGNLVEGNYIGTDITGKRRWVMRSTACSSTRHLGQHGRRHGHRRGQNTIAFNIEAGVLVESGTGDSILSNSIFCNGRLGIDLVAPGDPSSGVTPNEPGVRSGPNNLQNFPVIASLTSNGSVLTSGHAEQRAEYNVPDPVLHQLGGRS